MTDGMKISLATALAELPRPATAKWPLGIFDRDLFSQGGISVSIFAPRKQDFQTPHDEDEIYFIVGGSGEFDLAGEVIGFVPGDLIYVPAKIPHRFIDPPEDLATWVLFFPPSPSGDQPTG